MSGPNVHTHTHKLSFRKQCLSRYVLFILVFSVSLLCVDVYKHVKIWSCPAQLIAQATNRP